MTAHQHEMLLERRLYKKIDYIKIKKSKITRYTIETHEKILQVI